MLQGRKIHCLQARPCIIFSPEILQAVAVKGLREKSVRSFLFGLMEAVTTMTTRCAFRCTLFRAWDHGGLGLCAFCWLLRLCNYVGFVVVFSSVQFSSVQDGMYALGKAHILLSEVFPTLRLKRFQCSWLTMASSFHASLLQEVDGVMSLALCRQECLKLLNTLDLPRRKPLMRVASHANVSAQAFPLLPACPGQYTHRSFRRWMSTIDTFQSGLPIPLFVASSSNLWGWWHVWSDCHLWSWKPAQGMGDFCFYVTCITAWCGVLSVYFCLN